MSTVQQSFADMATRFKADRAAGLQAVIQFDITGEGGGVYHVDISQGACQRREGPAPSPQLTVSASAEDWLDMRARKLSPQVAFMSGRLRHKGEMGLLMKLPSLFDL
jgi:putative sterol carrier protein